MPKQVNSLEADNNPTDQTDRNGGDTSASPTLKNLSRDNNKPVKKKSI